MDRQARGVSSKPSSHWRADLFVGGAAAVAWGGMVIHNLADLPQLTATSRENTWPGAIWLLLAGLFAAVRRPRWPATLLWGWGWLNLIGGAISVLPLGLWPYHPEQSLRHYLFHALYALAQLPLLALAQSELRRRGAAVAVPSNPCGP
jgi:drug/metabolite transporter (DMT)-like permease